MDTLLGPSDEAKDDTARATVLAGLKVNLHKFGKDVLEHLDHEEHSFATPIARKVRKARQEEEGPLPLCICTTVAAAHTLIFHLSTSVFSWETPIVHCDLVFFYRSER